MKILVFILIFYLWDSTTAQSCKTPEEEDGNCIGIALCPPLNDLFKSAAPSHADRLLLSKSHCGTEAGKPKVCCPSSVDFEDRAGVNAARLLPAINECVSVVQDRIYGGYNTKITDYPFMALVKYSKAYNPSGYHCGGTLINNLYVLTAAHCINGLPSGWRVTGVRLGEWDTATDPDCDNSAIGEPPTCATAVIEIPVTETSVHPQYDSKSTEQHNDIALLRLSRKVKYNRYIQPICLPQSQNLRSLDLTGIKLLVAGWGKTQDRSKSNLKLVVDVDAVSLNECNQKYRSRSGIPSILKTQICAGGEPGKDSCSGDSGGPLFMYDDVSNPFRPYWLLVGVVSYGPKDCGTPGYPGVYTKTSEYMPWIYRTIRA